MWPASSFRDACAVGQLTAACSAIAGKTTVSRLPWVTRTGTVRAESARRVGAVMRRSTELRRHDHHRAERRLAVVLGYGGPRSNARTKRGSAAMAAGRSDSARGRRVVHEVRPDAGEVIAFHHALATTRSIAPSSWTCRYSHRTRPP